MKLTKRLQFLQDMLTELAGHQGKQDADADIIIREVTGGRQTILDVIKPGTLRADVKAVLAGIELLKGGVPWPGFVGKIETLQAELTATANAVGKLRTDQYSSHQSLAAGSVETLGIVQALRADVRSVRSMASAIEDNQMLIAKAIAPEDADDRSLRLVLSDIYARTQERFDEVTAAIYKLPDATAETVAQDVTLNGWLLKTQGPDKALADKLDALLEQLTAEIIEYGTIMRQRDSNREQQIHVRANGIDSQLTNLKEHFDGRFDDLFDDMHTKITNLHTSIFDAIGVVADEVRGLYGHGPKAQSSGLASAWLDDVPALVMQLRGRVDELIRQHADHAAASGNQYRALDQVVTSRFAGIRNDYGAIRAHQEKLEGMLTAHSQSLDNITGAVATSEARAKDYARNLGDGITGVSRKLEAVDNATSQILSRQERDYDTLSKLLSMVEQRLAIIEQRFERKEGSPMES
jgi:uncharacterized phage infection (PIP) family protein YhgE